MVKVMVNGAPIEPAALPGDGEALPALPHSPPLRGWQVVLKNFGLMILVGDSAKQIAGMLSHVRCAFKDKPHELVAFQAIAHDSWKASTVWLLPDEFKGVLGEAFQTGLDLMSGPGGAALTDALRAAVMTGEGSIIVEEDGVVEAGPAPVHVPVPEEEESGDGGSAS